jgi:hypothetical protein
MRNNGARPATVTPIPSLEAEEDLDATIPYGDDSDPMDNGADLIDAIRAKRKREEKLGKGPEPKKPKIEVAIPKPVGESTVLIVIHNIGHWELRTDKFVMK